MSNLSNTTIFYFILFISLSYSCGSSKVISGANPEINFRAYKTFVICTQDLEVKNTNYPGYDNPETRMQIKNALEHEMIKRGYTLKESDPDLQVGFRFVIKDQTLAITNCYDENEYSYWAGCKIETYNYTEESLVVYVSDLAKNEVIWQASIVKNITKSSDRLKKTIARTITKIFKEYPIKILAYLLI